MVATGFCTSFHMDTIYEVGACVRAVTDLPVSSLGAVGDSLTAAIEARLLPELAARFDLEPGECVTVHNDMHRPAMSECCVFRGRVATVAASERMLACSHSNLRCGPQGISQCRICSWLNVCTPHHMHSRACTYRGSRGARLSPALCCPPTHSLARSLAQTQQPQAV